MILQCKGIREGGGASAAHGPEVARTSRRAQATKHCTVCQQYRQCKGRPQAACKGEGKGKDEGKGEGRAGGTAGATYMCCGL